MGKPDQNPLKSRIVGEGEESPDQLLANPLNWRKHPKHQVDALEGLLEQVGWVQRVIVNRITGHVVDGHARVELAIRRGEPRVPVVYVELTPSEEKLVLASLDPIGGLATTDAEKLEELLEDVTAQDPALQAMLDSLIAGAQDADAQAADEAASVSDYSKKIEPPIYEPKGEKPEVRSLFDRQRADELIAEIDEAEGIPGEVRDFLRLAAQRHVVFDYHQIAEFYAHASPEVQALMEASALVIIDFEQAIERGYVELSKRLAEIYANTAEAVAVDDED